MNSVVTHEFTTGENTMNSRLAAVTPGVRRANWYQRQFATMMDSESKTTERYYAARKRALLGDLRGVVLEIGPGTGPNLPYYSRDVRWHGLEPNPAMFPYVQRQAQRLGMTIDLRAGRSETIDAPENTFDAVVSTLTLCSVADPERTLQEIRRVLKAGGRFVCIEHVAAPRGTGLRAVQRIVRPVWKPFSAGCHPDRETWAVIEDAGFHSVQLEHFRLDMPIVGPHIAGFAVK